MHFSSMIVYCLLLCWYYLSVVLLLSAALLVMNGQTVHALTYWESYGHRVRYHFTLLRKLVIGICGRFRCFALMYIDFINFEALVIITVAFTAIAKQNNWPEVATFSANYCLPFWVLKHSKWENCSSPQTVKENFTKAVEFHFISFQAILTKEDNGQLLVKY